MLAKLVDGKLICVWCKKPFKPENSDYENGHQRCAERYEARCNIRSFKKLVTACPSGTRFDFAGGASCEG
mgnify:CR=1